MLLKFTNAGELLLQVGRRGQSGGNMDTQNLKRPAEVFVYPETNEVLVADGYGTRRVIVLDAVTGAFKRMWGAFGNEPLDSSPEPPPDAVLGPPQFGVVHGLEVSNDGLVYVADRDNNHIQVFTADGTYTTQAFVNRNANPNTTAGLAFSADPGQQFLYAADLGNGQIHLLERETLDVLDSFGRSGVEPGDLSGVHYIATDSQGNLYTAEVQEGRRVQKFVLAGTTPGS